VSEKLTWLGIGLL